MSKLIIDNKKYLVVPEQDYRTLQKRALLKTKPEKLLSLDEGRKNSRKLVRKWAAEK